VARYDPSGATGYSADDAETITPATPFPDPFGPYPDEPYQAYPSDTTDTRNGTAAAFAGNIEPETDPAIPVIGASDWLPDVGFDPFAPDAFRLPQKPWYRKKSATIALGAIGFAVLAIIVSAVLLATLDSGGGSEPSDNDTPTTVTTAPTTTPLTSAPEPPPPPPPPPPSAETRSTWQPQYTYPRQPQNTRPHVTTPQTRGPDISVRPTHRPAFPGQPGEN